LALACRKADSWKHFIEVFLAYAFEVRILLKNSQIRDNNFIKDMEVFQYDGATNRTAKRSVL
jgi:hypothetical protein